MSASTLIIVVSNDLANIHSNVPQRFEGIDLLILEQENDGKPGIENTLGVEQAWRPLLEQRLIKLVKDSKAAEIRVAVHKKCVSLAERDEIRFFDGERVLRAECGVVDVLVMGFRHEVERVPVWGVLYKMKRLGEKAELNEAPPSQEAQELAIALKKALKEWHLAGLGTRIANCRAAVLKCVDSVAQELQWLKQQQEAGLRHAGANTEKILHHFRQAETELKKFVDFLSVNDPIIFDQLETDLTDLTGMLESISKNAGAWGNVHQPQQAVEKIDRWRGDIRDGFSQLELTLQGDRAHAVRTCCAS